MSDKTIDTGFVLMVLLEKEATIMELRRTVQVMAEKLRNLENNSESSK